MHDGKFILYIPAEKLYAEAKEKLTLTFKWGK